MNVAFPSFGDAAKTYFAEQAKNLSGLRARNDAQGELATDDRTLKLNEFSSIPRCSNGSLALCPVPYTRASSALQQLLSGAERALRAVDATINWDEKKSDAVKAHLISETSHTRSFTAPSALADLVESFTAVSMKYRLRNPLLAVREELETHEGYWSRLQGIEAVRTVVLALRAAENGGTSAGGGMPFVFWCALATVAPVKVVLLFDRVADLGLPPNARISSDASAPSHALKLCGLRRSYAPNLRSTRDSEALVFFLFCGIWAFLVHGDVGQHAASATFCERSHGHPDDFVVERNNADGGGDGSEHDPIDDVDENEGAQTGDGGEDADKIGDDDAHYSSGEDKDNGSDGDDLAANGEEATVRPKSAKAPKARSVIIPLACALGWRILTILGIRNRRTWLCSYTLSQSQLIDQLSSCGTCT